jgi:hypothetical protein
MCYIIMYCEVRLREKTLEIFVNILTKCNKLQMQCLCGRALKNMLQPQYSFILSTYTVMNLGIQTSYPEELFFQSMNFPNGYIQNANVTENFD